MRTAVAKKTISIKHSNPEARNAAIKKSINDDGFETDRMVRITPSVHRSGLVAKKAK